MVRPPKEARDVQLVDIRKIQCPRVSYLPFLLPRLYDFFAPLLINSTVSAHQGWFSYDGVPLKWQHPIGLLFDLFSGNEPVLLDDPDRKPGGGNGNSNNTYALPWKLTLHFGDWPGEQLIPLDFAGKVHHDAYMNSVKEADFLRNGTAKVIMSLSKDDSTKLWQSVAEHNLSLFRAINQKFLIPPTGTSLRHVPIKVYLPTTDISTALLEDSATQTRGSLKVVQALVPPMLSSKVPQTLGTALHGMLPTVFPSRRSYIHAYAVLHGAAVPLVAPVHDLMRAATYADGFLHVAVVMVS